MCSLFGVLDYGQTLSKKSMTRIISVLSRECEVRGTDATGIAYLNGGRMSIYKRPVPARRLRFHIPADCHIVMGHTRLTTQGSQKDNYNNHPFSGHASNMSFALAHNGILHNDRQLHTSEKLPLTNIKTDSFVAVQLIEKQNALNFESLRHMAEKVEGSFSFTVLDQSGNLYFVKGDSPMCICKFPTLGCYLYASTEEILGRAMKRLGLLDCEYEQVAISSGDILKIDSGGTQSWDHFSYEDIRRWGYCGSYFDHSLHDASFDEDYWEELRFVAGGFGYMEEDVDRLQELGYSPDEVEEIFYYCAVREEY